MWPTLSLRQLFNQPARNALWNRTYGGTGTNSAITLVQTNDGGYASIGSYGFVDLIKMDASGNMQWNKTYGLSVTALV